MIDQNLRDRPKQYIDKALDILFQQKYSSNTVYDIDILEIGSMRGGLVHYVDITTYECCNDGHSTYLFARTGWKMQSVNIDPLHLEMAKSSCAHFNNVEFYCEDAMQTPSRLNNCSIGLLFLDAWDLDVPGSAESHLEFYRKIRRVLKNNPLILIDDTDLYYDYEKKEYFPDPECMSGKGKLLIPELLNDGYEIVFKGRQTLLRKA